MKAIYSMRVLVNTIVWMEVVESLRVQFLTERNRHSVQCRFAGCARTALDIAQQAQV